MMLRRSLVSTLIWCCWNNVVTAFAPIVGSRNHGGFRSPVQSIARPPLQRLGGSTNSVDTELLDSLKSMRVKELVAELKDLKISTAGVFDKEELVRRLYQARKGGQTLQSTTATATAARPPPPPTATARISKDVPPDAIRGDITFTSMETGRAIPGFNSETIRIEAEGQPYPTMNIRVLDPPGFDLTLLLDTACSGFVLRPQTVQRYNMRTYNSAATMTGAAGTTGSAGLTAINQFMFGGETNGPLPVAIQDIGALPLSLDGIIGLSYISQFACMEMDLKNSQVTFYKKERQPPVPAGLQVVAQGELSRTRLGIWTVDTAIDGRGPIKMLVDTGATSSFLNWKGVEGLGLSRTSPLVRPLDKRVGALGSDNIAIGLTHQIRVERMVNFGVRPSHDGLPTTVTIDIGDIAILDTQLAADRVCGILGMDVLLQCSVIQMSFNGVTPKITLLK